MTILVSGSNLLFGRILPGGALVVRTKDGRCGPGMTADVSQPRSRLDGAACKADADRMTDPREATLSLLARRAPGATICPSEVARTIAPDWRGAMPAVHAAVDGLVRDGLVRLSWKGRPLAMRSGPYRIGRPGDD